VPTELSGPHKYCGRPVFGTNEYSNKEEAGVMMYSAATREWVTATREWVTVDNSA